MNEPIWLQDAVVTAIHSRQLAEHGGLDGVRDPGMLSSALARPKNALIINGQDFDATDFEKYQTFLGVADGAVAESQLADWIRSKLA